MVEKSSPTPAPGEYVLDRIQLEIWWMSGGQRRTFPLDSYRRRTLRQEDFAAGRAAMKRRPTAGVTLMELLIAVLLLSLLSVGLLFALRIGLNAYSKTQTRLMDNRRVAGAQRILEQELEGLVPVVAPCGAGTEGGGTATQFFQGEPETMRLVSTFSLQGAWRGQPQILEIFVIPGAEGRGVRLVVNEIPYQGPLAAGRLCLGSAQVLRSRRRAEFLRAGRQAGLLPLHLPGPAGGPDPAAALVSALRRPHLAAGRPHRDGAARSRRLAPAAHQHGRPHPRLSPPGDPLWRFLG